MGSDDSDIFRSRDRNQRRRSRIAPSTIKDSGHNRHQGHMWGDEVTVNLTIESVCTARSAGTYKDCLKIKHVAAIKKDSAI